MKQHGRLCSTALRLHRPPSPTVRNTRPLACHPPGSVSLTPPPSTVPLAPELASFPARSYIHEALPVPAITQNPSGVLTAYTGGRVGMLGRPRTLSASLSELPGRASNRTPRTPDTLSVRAPSCPFHSPVSSLPTESSPVIKLPRRIFIRVTRDSPFNPDRNS